MTYSSEEQQTIMNKDVSIDLRTAQEIHIQLDELLKLYADPKLASVEIWGMIQALRWVLKLRDDLKSV